MQYSIDMFIFINWGIRMGRATKKYIKQWRNHQLFNHSCSKRHRKRRQKGARVSGVPLSMWLTFYDDDDDEK